MYTHYNFCFRILCLLLTVYSYPSTLHRSKEQELKTFFREGKIDSIDKLNINFVRDDLSGYTLTKDEHDLGEKINDITFNFFKTGNILEFVGSIVTNYHGIQKYLDLMRKHNPRTYIFEDIDS